MAMALRTRISLVLALWFILEALAFSAVVAWIGVGGAVLLGIATSVLGGSLLKQAGRSALGRLRRGIGSGSGLVEGHAGLDDTLAAIGAVLLLLPGFVSDAIGLALAVPALRGWLGSFIGTGGFRAVRGKPRAQHGPTAIDLDPDEWRPVDEGRRRTIR